MAPRARWISMMSNPTARRCWPPSARPPRCRSCAAARAGGIRAAMAASALARKRCWASLANCTRKVLSALDVKGPAMAFTLWPGEVPAPRTQGRGFAQCAPGLQRPAGGRARLSPLSSTRSVEALNAGQCRRRGRQGVDRPACASLTNSSAARLGEGKKSLAITVRMQPSDKTLKDSRYRGGQRQDRRKGGQGDRRRACAAETCETGRSGTLRHSHRPEQTAPHVRRRARRPAASLPRRWRRTASDSTRWCWRCRAAECHVAAAGGATGWGRRSIWCSCARSACPAMPELAAGALVDGDTPNRPCSTTIGDCDV